MSRPALGAYMAAAGPLDGSWPTLSPAALHGLPGEVVATLDPHTEADPAAVLVSFLNRGRSTHESFPSSVPLSAERSA